MRCFLSATESLPSQTPANHTRCGDSDDSGVSYKPAGSNHGQMQPQYLVQADREATKPLAEPWADGSAT